MAYPTGRFQARIAPERLADGYVSSAGVSAPAREFAPGNFYRGRCAFIGWLLVIIVVILVLAVIGLMSLLRGRT